MFLDEKVQPVPVKTLEPWRQLLLDAADVIERQGHCKYRLQNHLGQVCWLGALMKVQNNEACDLQSSPVFLEAAKKTRDYLGLQFKFPGSHRFGDSASQMVFWNNLPERTGEEVIAAMRGAAKQAI